MRVNEKYYELLIMTQLNGFFANHLHNHVIMYWLFSDFLFVTISLLAQKEIINM